MGSAAMPEQLLNIWKELENPPGPENPAQKRRVRRLNLEKETGLRLSCHFPRKSWELLIEVGSNIDMLDISGPNWSGMAFEYIEIDMPVLGTSHICLRLDNPEHREVFTAVCSDLAEELMDITSPPARTKALIEFFERWSRFFESFKMNGLTPEHQRGLFGELWWMRRLLDQNISSQRVVNSWKGCERGYHDFEIDGRVVEVKTTVSKEPRRVHINNERQLDDRGLVSLHLFAASLIRSESGGESLPELISSIREKLLIESVSLRKFEHGLTATGYLDLHSHLYTASYTLKYEELFHVRSGFPRITEVPGGLGDLNYSLTIGACKSFLVDINEYFQHLHESIT
jgi:hypothetical protein